MKRINEIYKSKKPTKKAQPRMYDEDETNIYTQKADQLLDVFNSHFQSQELAKSSSKGDEYDPFDDTREEIKTRGMSLKIFDLTESEKQKANFKASLESTGDSFALPRASMDDDTGTEYLGRL